MNYKDKIKIDSMRIGGKILAQILDELKNYSTIGKSTNDIENYSLELLKKFKVKSAFRGFHDYKYNTCISINDEVVHGLPSKKIIKNKDIISIDMGVLYNSYNTDSAITFKIGNINKKIEKLINITKKSLDDAILLIKPNEHIGTIQAKIQNTIEENGFHLIKNLTGHGIGKLLQENPIIENYGVINSGFILKPGMTFCLEPMATIGNGNIKVDKDNWTIRTCDKNYSAHFEHTIAVTDTGYEILTKF